MDDRVSHPGVSHRTRMTSRATVRAAAAMSRVILLAAGMAAAMAVVSTGRLDAQPAAGAAAHTRPPHTFRVCADPDNMPATDDKLEGFDNKIAALMAKDLGDSVTYSWWPTRRGFVRNTLSASDCDVVFGVPKGYDLVLPTKPYYRSGYVAVTRSDRHLKITSLDDTVVKSLKIGVTQIGDNYTNTPPAQALGARGINRTVVGFTSFYSARPSTRRHHQRRRDGSDRYGARVGPAGRVFRETRHGAARSDGAAGHRSSDWLPLCV